MVIVDYIFYRIYVFMKKNDEAPVATAALGVSAFLMVAFPMIWIDIPFLIFGFMPEEKDCTIILVPLIIYISVYVFYKRRKKNVLEKYEHCKYNEKIPYFIIPLLFVVIAIAAIFVEMPVHVWLEDNHYDGIVLKWFLELFE